MQYISISLHRRPGSSREVGINLLPIATIALLVITTSVTSSPTSNAPVLCLASLPLPVNGQVDLSGFFILNLKCSSDKEDIPANAPGTPPGVLHCAPKENNHQIADLRLPECLPVKIPNRAAIGMGIRLTYKLDDPSNCQDDAGSPGNDYYDVGWNLNYYTTYENPLDPYRPIHIVLGPTDADNDKLNNIFSSKITPKIQNICPTCDPELVKSMDCYKTDGHAIKGRNLGYIMEYDQKHPVDYYMNIFQKISETLDNSISELNLEDAQLIRVDYTPWKTRCDSIPNSMGTILHLQHKVSCRGCPESFFLDPNLKNRCLQCPWGKWTRRQYSSTSSDHFNGFSDCSPCPGIRGFTNRQEYLRLCYYRVNP